MGTPRSNRALIMAVVVPICAAVFVLVGSVLIGVITALLKASGIDDVVTKTLGPATQMAADAVEWKMGNYWTALQETAASDIFQESDPTAPDWISSSAR